MKRHSLIAGAAFLLMAGPVAAAEAPASGLMYSGVVDFWGGYVFMDQGEDSDGDEPEDTGRFGARGRINVPLGENVSTQFDVDIELDFNKEDDDSIKDYERAAQFGLHLSWRDPSSYLFGIFGGGGVANVNDDESERGYMAGGEGQFYLGNTTFYGQAGYFDTEGNDDETLVDAFFVRGVVRHFFDPDSMVSAEVLYGAGDNTESTPDDIDVVGWEVMYQRRLASMGAGALFGFIAYDGHYMMQEDDPGGTEENLTEHVIKVGLSFMFGPSSLQENDRRGATLDLPLDMLRTAGYTVDIID